MVLFKLVNMNCRWITCTAVNTGVHSPASTIHRAGVVFMLGQRLRRWPNTKTTPAHASCLLGH